MCVCVCVRVYLVYLSVLQVTVGGGVLGNEYTGIIIVQEKVVRRTYCSMSMDLDLLFLCFWEGGVRWQNFAKKLIEY